MVPPAHMEQHLRQVIYARHKLAKRRYDDQTLTQDNFPVSLNLRHYSHLKNFTLDSVYC